MLFGEVSSAKSTYRKADRVRLRVRRTELLDAVIVVKIWQTIILNMA
ncbi:hypothetical protein CKA32_000372 [Geitlerinema sp. FC II]|nr:hypothetical protein CKA32_000372 [Geitlerinema sp. FC II]